jgi:hypothetical protein
VVSNRSGAAKGSEVDVDKNCSIELKDVKRI